MDPITISFGLQAVGMVGGFLSSRSQAAATEQRGEMGVRMSEADAKIIEAEAAEQAEVAMNGFRDAEELNLVMAAASGLSMESFAPLLEGNRRRAAEDLAALLTSGTRRSLSRRAEGGYEGFAMRAESGAQRTAGAVRLATQVGGTLFDYATARNS